MYQDDTDRLPLWQIDRDDQGNAVLAWVPGTASADERHHDSDELAQTQSYLRRLDIPTLTIEGEEPQGESAGFDPYNTGAWQKRKQR